MPEYTHTLIPEQFNFVPVPKQIGEFLSSLVSIGAAPLDPTMDVSKLSGKVQSFVNPFTGETVSRPMRKSKKVKQVDAVARELESLDDYNVTMAGKGPPGLPAFVFDFD